MKKSIIFGSIILIIGIQWSYPQSMNDKNRELNRNSKVGLPEFSPSDEERTTEFQQTGVQSQNEPPTIYNSYVLPQYGNRGSGVIFHYRIFYQDPEGQAPAIRNLYINESSQPLQMQIAAAGSYTTGKELYYDLSVDSPLLINGANHYYMEVSDDNTQNLVRDPETGFYAFPFVGTDFDAEFVGTPTFGAAPLKVQFTDQSTGDITGWSWSFGDGGGAISRNPYHIYNNPGTYTVSLKILGPAGSNTETKVDYITVQGGSIPPTANFSASPTSGPAPLFVQFTNLSTGDITSYSWTFGDGGTSTSANPTHTYNSEGTYTVALTVTGPAGTHSKLMPALIHVGSQAPVANFTASPRSGDQPLTVQFNDLSTGEITSRTWFFGDGGSSSLTNPSHVYTQAGTFTVSLTINGPGGSDTSTKEGFITVNPTAGPVADFSGNPTSGTAPLSVQFTDLSSGNITSRTWNFGDGSSSTATNPSHTYTQAGIYSVNLTVSGPDGSNTITKSNYITVTSGGTAPVANFTGSPTSGNSPLSVQFTDQSTGTITSRSWNFGDGGSSTLTNPGHIYTQAGSYTVSLTVSGPNGSNTHTKSNYITVTTAGSAPVANFSASPTSGNSPLPVQFTDQSTGTITSRTWNFGDGGSSTAVNPSHTYNQAGSYTVSLTVSGPDGSNTHTKSNYINVTTAGSAPVADFSGSPTAGYQPLTVNFTDKSSGEITNRTYKFGDGSTSTAINPSHTYNNIGTFDVQLTVTGPYGSDSKTRKAFITVSSPNDGPIAEFSAMPTYGKNPLTVQFTDLSSGNINSRTWNFGDGNTSTAQNPGHTYANTGVYTVRLTVRGSDGTDSMTKADLITVTDTEDELQANFWAEPLSGNAPLSVEFSDKSIGYVTKWKWDFGDGQTSSEPNPNHHYENAGYYSIGLTVEGPVGTDSKTRRNFIEVFRSAGLESVDVSIPTTFHMINYPNPFNPRTTIQVALPKTEIIEIDVLNLKGERVDYLYFGELTAGYHTIDWHPSSLPSNIYFIRMKSPSYHQVTKCILLK